MVNFDLLEGDEYYRSILEELPKAKKRVVLASMIMLWGERTAPLFIMLQDALKRGVKVTILLDSYTRMRHLYGIHGPAGAKRLQQTFRTLEDLSVLGAKVYSFGKIGFPPQKGRCHVKITVIDNKSYSFGGINFSDESFDFTDYMLVSSSVKTADCLEQLVDRICRTRPPLSDGEVVIDKEHSVLFDGGRPKHSIIYERACELTAQARRVYFASQMIPTGQLARLLHETEAHIFTNRPEQMDPIASLTQAFGQQKYRTHNAYTGQAYIHAKVMLFELPGDKKVLLAGSNNFSYLGVAFGTQEIAMQASNPNLWDKVYTFVEKQIIKPRYKKSR